MANWRKLLKPQPVDLGTRHLDEVVEPETYVQTYVSRATKANGYPWDRVAGTLVVLPWNPAAGQVIAVFYAWNGGIAKRTYEGGAWRPWLDALGKVVE